MLLLSTRCCMSWLSVAAIFCTAVDGIICYENRFVRIESISVSNYEFCHVDGIVLWADGGPLVTSATFRGVHKNDPHTKVAELGCNFHEFSKDEVLSIPDDRRLAQLHGTNFRIGCFCNSSPICAAQFETYKDLMSDFSLPYPKRRSAGMMAEFFHSGTVEGANATKIYAEFMATSSTTATPTPTTTYIKESSVTATGAESETSEVITADTVTSANIKEESTTATTAESETIGMVTSTTSAVETEGSSEAKAESKTIGMITATLAVETEGSSTEAKTTSKRTGSTATTGLAAEDTTTTTFYFSFDHRPNAITSEPEFASGESYPFKEEKYIILGAGGLSLLLLVIFIACIIASQTKPKGEAYLQEMLKQQQLRGPVGVEIGGFAEKTVLKQLLRGLAEKGLKSGDSAEETRTLKGSKEKKGGSAEGTPALKGSKEKKGGSAEKAPALKRGKKNSGGSAEKAPALKRSKGKSGGSAEKALKRTRKKYKWIY